MARVDEAEARRAPQGDDDTAADSAWLIGSEASKSSTRYSRRVQATPVRLEFSRYTSRTLAPSRPRNCCMVSPSTLSPLKRMQYISRATRSRFCGEETRAACSTSSRVDVARDRPCA